MPTPILFGCQIDLVIFNVASVGVKSGCVLEANNSTKIPFVITPVPGSEDMYGDPVHDGSEFVLRSPPGVGSCSSSFPDGVNNVGIKLVSTTSKLVSFELTRNDGKEDDVDTDAIFTLTAQFIVTGDSLGFFVWYNKTPFDMRYMVSPDQFAVLNFQFTNPTDCPPSTTKYSCVADECIEDIEGTLTKEDCEKDCGGGGGTTYNCNDGTCEGVTVGLPGPYPTLEDCENECGVTAAFGCVNNKCIAQDNGKYGTFSDCAAKCGATNNGLSTTTIVIIITGTVVVLVGIIVGVLYAKHIIGPKPVVAVEQ